MMSGKVCGTAIENSGTARNIPFPQQDGDILGGDTVSVWINPELRSTSINWGLENTTFTELWEAKLAGWLASLLTPRWPYGCYACFKHFLKTKCWTISFYLVSSFKFVLWNWNYILPLDSIGQYIYYNAFYWVT